MTRKKLLLIGHARHGKDTAAEFLRDLFGYKFESSSQAASRIFLFDALRHKYKYDSPEQCFADRVNHRAEWHDLISVYNAQDPARLAKEIMKNAEIYVGMRSDREISECVYKRIFDLVIGIYAPGVPEEAKDSFSINLWVACDIIIPNSGTKETLRNRLLKLKPLLISTI